MDALRDGLKALFDATPLVAVPARERAELDACQVAFDRARTARTLAVLNAVAAVIESGCTAEMLVLEPDWSVDGRQLSCVSSISGSELVRVDGDRCAAAVWESLCQLWHALRDCGHGTALEADLLVWHRPSGTLGTYTHGYVTGLGPCYAAGFSDVATVAGVTDAQLQAQLESMLDVLRLHGLAAPSFD